MRPTARRPVIAAYPTLLTLALAACSSTPSGKPPRAFSHAAHLDAAVTGQGGAPLACPDCHLRADRATWVTARPGKAEHAPCDTCHADAFRAPPGPICATCHVEVDPRREELATLVPFPRGAKRWALGGAFAHATHLAATVDDRRLDCHDCHRVDGPDAAYATLPVHDDCARCHAPDRPAAAAARMDDCRRCHNHEGPARLRAYARNDVRFTHGRHRVDQSGAEIACTRCHGAVPESAAGEITLPAMATCATCHEDPARTPDRVRIARCGICHTSDVESRPLPGDHTAARLLPADPTAARLPPADGASPTPARHRVGDFPIVLAQAPVERDTATDAVLRLGAPRLRDLMPAAFDDPITDPASTPAPPTSTPHPAPPPLDAPAVDRAPPHDHTPLFRRHHADAARAPGALCHHCHAGVPAAARDGCQACHALSRPASHTLRFRTVTHGRDAARDPRACATCHEADQCAACHAVPPPSHVPGFVDHHDRLARANPRACLGCHAFESTCFACHDGRLPAPRSPR